MSAFKMTSFCYVHRYSADSVFAKRHIQKKRVLKIVSDGDFSHHTKLYTYLGGGAVEKVFLKDNKNVPAITLNTKSSAHCVW